MQYMLFSIYVVGYYHVYFKYNLNFNITWLSFTYCFVFFIRIYVYFDSGKIFTCASRGIFFQPSVSYWSAYCFYALLNKLD